MTPDSEPRTAPRPAARWRGRAGAVLALGVFAALAGGCGQLGYYAQAAHGQWAVLADARPLDAWLGDPAVDPKLKARLAVARELRRFAVRELALPDNGSYTHYADIQRPYVLWNVVAAPELSLKPRQWCFPVAGCVSYRGYYSQAAAEEMAAGLRAQGEDVQVSGVPAYSTLGWFDDPFLSTFIHLSDAELARLLFHELAHQVVYVAGDTQFNESFSTAVEEAGVERWLAARGDAQARERHAQATHRRAGFLALLQKHRAALDGNYKGAGDDAAKRARKAAIFAALREEYQTLKASWGGYAGYDRWFDARLGNAHLAAVAAYHDLVPGFKALLEQEKGFAPFFAAVRCLAQLERGERRRRLGGEVGEVGEGGEAAKGAPDGSSRPK